MNSYFDKLTRAEAQVTLPVDYQLVREGSTEVVILLHGFAQSAPIINHLLIGGVPEKYSILSINGPFPMAERKDNSFDIRFAWYFYDSFQEKYFIDYAPAVMMIKHLVSELRLDMIPKRIVGYSQGGYLAPFVAQALQEVKQVVGVSSHYLKDEMKTPVKYRLDALHGEKDDVVDCAPAQTSHQALVKLGMAGEFKVLTNETHRLTPAFSAALKEILIK